MTNKIIVLGAGLVGSAIAIDLSKNHEVTSVDLNTYSFSKFQNYPTIKTIQANLSDTDKVKSIIKDFDLVIGAVPGSMGYQTMKAVIEAGKNMVDISFMPEDFLELDELAKKHKVSVVADCGVGPTNGKGS